MDKKKPIQASRSREDSRARNVSDIIRAYFGASEPIVQLNSNKLAAAAAQATAGAQGRRLRIAQPQTAESSPWRATSTKLAR